MEVQFFHYNDEYASPLEAEKEQGGLAALAVLFQVLYGSQTYEPCYTCF